MQKRTVLSSPRILWAALLMVGLFSAALAGAQVQPCDTAYNNFNGPKRLYMNLHNCGDDCTQETAYLELMKDGITGVRIAPVTLDNTRPGQRDFFTVNGRDPYFTAVKEIFGPENILALIDDGVDSGPNAKPSPNDILRKLSSFLTREQDIRHIEFMNEPLNFSNITPEEYVARYLRPARALVDSYNEDRAADNQILLYSGAWFGTVDGVRQTRRMVRAGGLRYVDVMTVHLYERRVEDAAKRAKDYKRLARGVPIAVTETNFNLSNLSNYDSQFWWICQSMTEVERIMLQGLDPQEQLLQHNVFYTLRADYQRRFNIINFADFKTSLWTSTGPGHFVIRDRSQVPTDPKIGKAPEAEAEDEAPRPPRAPREGG